jgi:hypothetical protein
MAGYNFRWGDDVQPYIRQLASEHIERLRDYCHGKICKIMDARDINKYCVVPLIPNAGHQTAMKAKAVHRFRMLGFHFELRESPPSRRPAKPEFVLNFTLTPDFQPKDMPPRLKRIAGKPLSARPRGRAPPLPRAAPRRRAGGQKRVLTVSHTLFAVPLWISGETAALLSFLKPKLYKMYGLYQRLSVPAALMWKRRPRLGAPFCRVKFLTPLDDSWTIAPTRARLEPQLLGESIRLLLFSFVSGEPALWDADLFGRVAPGDERILA